MPAKIWYKTHHNELLAIVEVFKTWQHYLKGCKHKVLMLTNYNNLCCFMETKNLSSGQVWWAQELSQYHFRIHYYQGKANGAVDGLSYFFQRNKNENKKLQAKNTWILHCLQSLPRNATLLGLSVLASLSLLCQVLICRTQALPQFRRFSNLLQTKLTNEGSYLVKIGSMRLRL